MHRLEFEILQVEAADTRVIQKNGVRKFKCWGIVNSSDGKNRA